MNYYYRMIDYCRRSGGAASQASNIIDDKTIFSDRPPGPLDRYRRLASFDWRKFTLLLETEQCLRFRVSTENVRLLLDVYN